MAIHPVQATRDLERNKIYYGESWYRYYDSFRTTNGFILTATFIGVSMSRSDVAEQSQELYNWMLILGSLSFVSSLIVVCVVSGAERMVNVLYNRVEDVFYEINGLRNVNRSHFDKFNYLHPSRKRVLCVAYLFIITFTLISVICLAISLCLVLWIKVTDRTLAIVTITILGVASVISVCSLIFDIALGILIDVGLLCNSSRGQSASKP